jgi:hypothetical protein
VTQFDWTGFYDPPERDRMFALSKAGDVTTSTTILRNMDGSVVRTDTEKKTYLGQVHITVAAGAFDTCKFLVESSSQSPQVSGQSPRVAFEWYAKTLGMLVLSEQQHPNGSRSVEELQGR